MTKRLSEFISDKIQYRSVLCSLLLLSFHIYQYIDSGFKVDCLIRCIFCGIYPFIVLAAGRKGIPYFFLAFALTIEQYSTFNNYTAFIICCLYIAIKPNMKLWILLVYVIDVFVVCERHDKNAAHLLIHFTNCAFIYFAINMILQSFKDRIKSRYNKLKLDESERYILQQLASGARQKEIDRYSENTVSKKLKACRERNCCSSNSELLMRFMSENPINHI